MAGSPPDIEGLGLDDLKVLVLQLLEENAALRAEVAVLGEEIARLKGPLAYGSGDLHLPLGWGSLPWEKLLTEPAYPEEVILNDELHPTYWFALGDDVAEMRRLAGLMERRNPPG